MALAAAQKTAQEEGTGTPRLIGFLEPRLRPWGLVTAAGVPSVMARVDVDGTVLTVLGTHPLPPGGSDYSRLRNDQLAALPGFLEAVETPVVLLGDLNATPWCWHFRRLLRRTGLRNSSRGWGVQPTWPVFSVLFRIPIDHLLHSPDLRVVQRAIGPDVGSDHYPVVVDLRLP